MPKKSKKKSKKGRRGAQNTLMGASSTRMPYSQVVRVSGRVLVNPSTGGNTFFGVTPFTTGGGSQFTANSTGTNYATLSQWNDIRCAAIKLTHTQDVQGTATNPSFVVAGVAALDSTGADTAGGTATGAFLSIGTRQSSKRFVTSTGQFRTVSQTFKPLELNNRLWGTQEMLSAAPAAANQNGINWGVVLAYICPVGSVTVALDIDWFFEVRDPQLTGVLLGTETDEVRRRLERLSILAFVPPQQRKPSDQSSHGILSADVQGTALATRCLCGK